MGIWAGAGWGVAGGLVVALVITIWVLVSVLALLRKTTDPRPAQGRAGEVLPLDREPQRGQGRV